MKFLCLGYFDADKMARSPESEVQAALAECGSYLRELHATGRVLVDIGADASGMTLSATASGPIEAPLTAVGRLVGGVFVVEADTLAEAVKLAALHPTTRVSKAVDFGWHLEVRPIHSFTLPENHSSRG